MIKWLDCRDWEKAFLEVIPERKLKKSTVLKNGVEVEVEEEEEEEEEEDDEDLKADITEEALAETPKDEEETNEDTAELEESS